MKLLFDNNLSPKLVEKQLADVFPDSSHVRLLGFSSASDLRVWEIAQTRGYTLVSKDSDFNDLVTAKGFPQKLIWLHIVNCTTAELAALLLRHHDVIATFVQDDNVGLLEIF